MSGRGAGTQVLPTFIVIGAPRAGTTTLYEHLKEHPEVGMSALKETNYFAYEPGKTDPPEVPGWFPVRTLEAYADQFAHAAGCKAVGEASPIYLSTPGTAARIRALLPRVRLVAVLRNPVERAYSGYITWLHLTNRRLDPRSDLTLDADWIQPDSPWVRSGFYADHLREYRKHFPPEQIKIYLFRDLTASPETVLRDLHAYLGIASRPLEELARHNRGGQPRISLVNAVLRNRGLRRRLGPWTPAWLQRAGRRIVAANREPVPALPRAVEQSLRETYRGSIHDLETMLDRDLKAWLEPRYGGDKIPDKGCRENEGP